ncbi:guanine nucleotide-binding protein subunit alpha [Tulasnella sp. UAMH 9824]|nr:guanine nucleotide-binding protein subunit alpha [Tulasnella sp. UAMH 9824]
MGCTQSAHVDPEAASRNQEIERQLKKDKAEAKKQVNILLLGAGESGKSTVLKQMKLMYDGEYTDQERLAYKEIIFANVVQCMSVVLQSLEGLGLAIQTANEPHAEVVTSGDQSSLGEDHLSQPLSEALIRLWRDPAVVAAVGRSKEFQLNDSATYFFDAVERFSQPGYMPNNQILFLNKIDLLQEKLRARNSPIRDVFEDYTGPDDGSDADFDYACEYFRRLFLARNQSSHKRLITHLTCATDTKQIKVVITTVNEHILKNNLEEVGFV